MTMGKSNALRSSSASFGAKSFRVVTITIGLSAIYDIAHCATNTMLDDGGDNVARTSPKEMSRPPRERSFLHARQRPLRELRERRKRILAIPLEFFFRHSGVTELELESEGKLPSRVMMRALIG